MKFLVIGDSCLDVYIYCNCGRLCPEAPVPILDINRVVKSEGMAGNTFRNLQRLTEECELITNANTDEITKSRYVDEKTNHMFIRIDKTEKTERINLLTYADKIRAADCVIISDYDKGFLLEDDIAAIANMNPNVFLDTKKLLGAWAANVKIIKINSLEYLRSMAFVGIHDLDNKIIVTQGATGATWRGKTYPVQAVEIKDLSGAGDTFHAALAWKFTMSHNMEWAIKFANDCATAVVQKKGTSVF